MVKKIWHIVLLLGFSILSVFAQKKAEVTPQIANILVIADSYLKQEELEKARRILDSLKRSKKYKNNEFDRLAIDIRNVQILHKYQLGEKAVTLILDGLNELQNFPESRIQWKYNYEYVKILERDRLFKKALKYSNIAILNALVRKDTLDLLNSYHQRANIFWAKSETLDTQTLEFTSLCDSMIYWSNKIIEYPAKSKTKSKIATGYHNLSIALLHIDLSLSKTYIKKSIELKSELEKPLSYASSTNAYGNIFYMEENYLKAIEEYKKAYNLIIDDNRTIALMIKEPILQNISWAYSELGDYKNGFEYQEMATELKDSLDRINQSRNIAAAEARYLEQQKTEQEKSKKLKTQIRFYGLALFTMFLGVLGYMTYVRLTNRQRRTERKITGLKYKALNAQMNPHFINNLLVSINELIDSNNKKTAIKHLDKFNKLTNLVLKSTKHNLITLSEELEMLQLYLDLQLIRFENKFEYLINTNELTKDDANQIRIPPLIVQPLVENSIVHGLKDSTKKGRLTIDFRLNNDDYLICTITDNGTQKTRTLNTQLYSCNGISLKNINERLMLINQNKKNQELVSFETLRNKLNSAIGSRTQLNIPLIYG